MLDDKMRLYKDKMFIPLARRLGHLSPNAITITAMLFGLAAAAFAARQMFLIAFGLWLVNRILDGLDGLMARLQDRQTDFGGYLDIVADFVVYAAVPIGILLGQPSVALGISLALLLGSFYVNAASWMYLAAILEKRNLGATVRGEPTTVTMPAGLVGGTETILFFSTFLIFPGIVQWLFLAMAALTMVGVLQRVRWARVHLHPVSPHAVENAVNKKVVGGSTRPNHDSGMAPQANR